MQWAIHGNPRSDEEGDDLGTSSSDRKKKKKK